MNDIIGYIYGTFINRYLPNEPSKRKIYGNAHLGRSSSDIIGKAINTLLTDECNVYLQIKNSNTMKATSGIVRDPAFGLKHARAKGALVD
eukprot:IDg7249t1